MLATAEQRGGFVDQVAASRRLELGGGAGHTVVAGDELLDLLLLGLGLGVNHGGGVVFAEV